MKDYGKAYKEVYTILNYLGKEELNKIPKEVISAIRDNQDNNYVYIMNEDLNLENQPMLPETKAILFNLFRDYLSTPMQREKIIKMQQEDRRNEEENKKQTYVNNNMFESKKEKEILKTVDLHPTVGIKKNIFKRIIKYIKQLLIS